MEYGTTYTSPSPKRELKCPSCKEHIQVYDSAGSEYYGCKNCGAYFHHDIDNGNTKILEVFRKPVHLGGGPTIYPNRTLPHLVIGTGCVIDDKEYTVTGYIVKQQRGDRERWNEYLLFNPSEEYYTTLSLYNGHWSIIKYAAKQDYKSDQYGVYTDSKQYERFLTYQFDILQATGEFDWNVLDDEKITVSEYVHPPFLLAKEKRHNQEPVWFEGEYRTKRQIARLFNLDKKDLPPEIGYSPLQPYDPEGRNWAILRFTLLLVAIFIAIHFIDGFYKPEKTLLTYAVEQVPDSSQWGSSKMVVSPSFNVTGPAALEIDVSAFLANDWVEVPMTLVNESTGATIDVSKTLEYYSGVDGGESWSEGSNNGEVILSKIPSGKYHLNVEVFSSDNLPKAVDVTVKQNPTMTSNLLLMLLFILAYPIILLLYKYHMRNSIWGEN